MNPDEEFFPVESKQGSGANDKALGLTGMKTGAESDANDDNRTMITRHNEMIMISITMI